MSNKSRIKCVVFDIDETLHRNSKSSKLLGRKIKLQVLEENGFSISFETYEKALDTVWIERNVMRTRGRFALEAASLKYLGIPDSTELCEKLARAFYDWRMRDKSLARIAPGVKDLFRFLEKKEIVTGVISDSDFSWSRVWMKYHKLPILEHRIIISNEVNMDKSGVKIFRLFLSRLREEFPEIKPSQILMVGDQSRDMNAKKAGFRTCWYNPERKPLPKDWKIIPDFEIHHFSELKSVMGEK